MLFQRNALVAPQAVAPQAMIPNIRPHRLKQRCRCLATHQDEGSSQGASLLLDRRQLMVAMVGISQLMDISRSGPGRAASAAEVPWQSSVPPSLSVKDLTAIINDDRPACWKSIAQHLQALDFTQLSESLDVAPFADLRQATFYIPWAILQRDDYPAAVDTRKSSKDFESHVLDLQRAALSAAEGQTEPATVQQAFILMSASLDSFLATIPATYQGSKA